MKRSFFVAFSLACGIAMTSMLAGCSSKPSPENVQAGLKRWLLQTFNFSGVYNHIPISKIDISVEKCFPQSNDIMSQMKMSDADRENYGKRFQHWQFCHVEISDGTQQYKVLLTVYQAENEQTKDMDYCMRLP